MTGVLNSVSRETIARLESFVALLRKWNPAINLVARSTLDDVWQRHIADSAQAFGLIPQSARHLGDLGSGGGFPGLVFAVLAAELRPELKITLMESDQRKAAFLMTVAREVGVSVTVLASRIEAVTPLSADIISARALAPLSALLGYAERHLSADGQAIFLKGANWAAEVQEALANWRFSVQNTPSTTDPSAVILTIGGLSRA